MLVTYLDPSEGGFYIEDLDPLTTRSHHRVHAAMEAKAATQWITVGIDGNPVFSVGR